MGIEGLAVVGRLVVITVDVVFGLVAWELVFDGVIVVTGIAVCGMLARVVADDDDDAGFTTAVVSVGISLTFGVIVKIIFVVAFWVVIFVPVTNEVVATAVLVKLVAVTAEVVATEGLVELVAVTAEVVATEVLVKLVAVTAEVVATEVLGEDILEVADVVIELGFEVTPHFGFL